MVPLRRPPAGRWRSGGPTARRVGRKLGLTVQKLGLRRRVAMARPRLPRLLRPATVAVTAVTAKVAKGAMPTVLAASKRYHSR